jgi:hypothetical protein
MDCSIMYCLWLSFINLLCHHFSNHKLPSPILCSFASLFFSVSHTSNTEFSEVKGQRTKLHKIKFISYRIATARGDRTQPNLKNLSDQFESKHNPFGSEPDLISFKSQTDPTQPEPDPTRLDSTRNQMTYNPIEIYQRSKKTQYVN